MIRISQLKLPITHTKAQLEKKIAKTLKNPENSFTYEIKKQSLDCRHKNDKIFVYTVDVTIRDEQKLAKKVNNNNIMLIKEKPYEFPSPGETPLLHSPVIVGSGPAGLFCGWYLAKTGYCPIILERGEEAEKRQKTVENFWKNGVLDSESNVQFGEGGAGTFSDGKLNTLVKDPYGRNHEVLKRFDFAVANPPFSLKNWTDGLKDYGRFDGYGDRPPEKNGDFAWLLHILKSLKSTGKAAVILPHGVLFRGNAEATIRKAIIDKGYIKGIIGLPSNLFYGTGIPACIIIIDKADAAERKGIFMIDASHDFVKDGNKNRLRERDIYKIVTTFNQQITDDPKYARFVPNDEIKKKNEYNLNIPRYIDSSTPEDLQDIDAHLHGGIPATDVDSMEKYWVLFPGLKDKLFSQLRDGYYRLNIPKEDIRNVVYNDPAFSAYTERIDNAFDAWMQMVDSGLRSS